MATQIASARKTCAVGAVSTLLLAFMAAACSEDRVTGPVQTPTPSFKLDRGTDVITVMNHNVYVGAETVIGEKCILYPGTVVRERCRIGNRVILHPNVSVGADGFGYEFHQGKHNKIPHLLPIVRAWRKPLEWICSLPGMP